MTASPSLRSAPTAPVPLLSVRHLRIPRSAGSQMPGRTLAVEDFHLDQREGEVVVIVGEADSGVSDLAAALAGRRAGVSGSVRYRGDEQVAGKPPHDVALIAPAPFADIKPRKAPTGVKWFMDLIAAALPRAGDDERARHMSQLLGRVGLIGADLHRPLPQFDASVAARLSLAAALLKPLRLLVVDEPVSGYDIAPFAALVRSLQAEFGFALIYGTRDLPLALGFGQRVIVVYRGRVAEVAPAGQIQDRPRHPYVRLQLGEEALTAAARDMEVGEYDINEPVQGCNFHPSCPLSDPMCIRGVPGLRRVGDEHYAACHFVAAS